MEFILNLSLGKATKVRLNGRDYLTGRVTSIVPGILPGSEGALLYPEKEIQNSVRDWDGMPLTIYHPMTENGQPASAQDSGVLKRQGCGFIKDTTFNGKLQHRYFLDLEKTKQIDNHLPEAIRVVPRVLNGQPIEVSTGLYTENEEVPDGTLHKGRPYDAVARNYKPDHLAILPDQVGACSVNDGCGLNINTKNNSNSTSNGKGVMSWLGKLFSRNAAPLPDGGNPASEDGDEAGRGGQGGGGLGTGGGSQEDIEARDRSTIDEEEQDAEETTEPVINSCPSCNNLYTGMACNCGYTINSQVINGGPGSGRHAGGSNPKAIAARESSLRAESLTDKARDGWLTKAPVEAHAKAANAHYDAANAHKMAAAFDEEHKGEHQQAADEHIKLGDFHIRKSKGLRNAKNRDRDRHESGRFLADGASAGKGNLQSMAKQGITSLTGRLDSDTGDSLNPLYDEPGDVDVDGESTDGKPTDVTGKTPPGPGKILNAFGGDMAPHSTTKDACGASIMTEDPKIRDHALSAMDASADGDREGAIKSHLKAAGLHEKAATVSRKDGELDDAAGHDNAAALHRKAASMHSALVNNGGPGSGRHKGESTAAYALSKHASSPEEHEAAATAHYNVAEKLKDSGDKNAAFQHYQKGQFHSRAAQGYTENKGDQMAVAKTVTRNQVLKAITANCTCSKKKAAYNEMSNRELVAIYNAMKGTRQAQEEEDDDEEGDGEDLMVNEEDAIGVKGSSVESGGYATNPDEIVAPQLKGGKVEKKGILNALRQHGTQQDIEIWENAVIMNQNAKKQLISQLIANVSDKALRKRLIAVHNQKSLQQLKDEVAALPVSNRGRGYSASPSEDVLDIASSFDTTFAPGFGNVHNAQHRQEDMTDDLLEPPTINFKKAIDSEEDAA